MKELNGSGDDRTLISEEVAATHLPDPGKGSAVNEIASAIAHAVQQAEPVLSEDSQPSSSGAGTGEVLGKIGADKEARAGTRIHHYEIIRQLGRGGMGSVYLARDTRLGRRVAIKFLHSDNPQLTQRFILEARTTARCSHENIVVIFEVDQFEGAPFMVLEYLQGKTLSDVLEKGQRVPIPRTVELMVPVVRALAYAHSQKIVHRDLKPANIVLTDSGTIKVLDFGIAKVLQRGGREELPDNPPPTQELPAVKGKGDEVTLSLPTGKPDDLITTELTRHGTMMGTMPFMAPEQWRASATIDHRADIWAVGIMLFRMLAGRHPLHDLRGEQLYVVGIYDQPMPKLRDMAPDVPQALADVVDKCLQKRKEHRFADANALLRALEPFLPGRFASGGHLSEDESPYAGLASFQEGDAHRFFGRGREVAALANRLADTPLMAIVGTSGAGKSSFVRAGLVPALKSSGEAWESIVVRPGRHPLAALASVVAPLLKTSTSLADDLSDQRSLIEKLRSEPGYVGTLLRSRARREKRKILLFVDQFEELYTQVPDAAERLAFTACLAGIADDATAPTRVTLSIRSDFLDRVAEDRGFMSELSRGLFFLNAPDRDGLRSALVQPAEMAGYRFEAADMVESMLDHLQATPGALPLLQFAASRLWESRDPSRKLLTRQSYDAIGGIAGALASHADAVLSGMTGQKKALARTVLLRLVTPERTRAIVSLEELAELSREPAELRAVVDSLVHARLLVVQTGGAGGGTLEIVHESLIHSWPMLRRWLEESGEDAAFIEQLRNASRQWAGKGRDPGLLWRGEVVEEARRFHARNRRPLPASQQEFLEAVFAQETRVARRKRALAFAGVSFLVLLVAASVIALVVIRRAQRQAEFQAVLARHAEMKALDSAEEVKKQLREVEAKELERQAEARRAEAEAKRAAEAAQRAEEARAEVAAKNSALIDALQKAEWATRAARRAKNESDESAQAAQLAREEALKAAKDLQSLLLKEQERVSRLQSQLGSPVIETLK